MTAPAAKLLSHSAIRRLFCGFSAAERSRRLVLMIAFFDASGTMGDSSAFVMAGYLGTPDAWEAFVPEWQRALDEPKAIDYFKMREAWRKKDQFAGWSDDERDNKLRLLAPITNRHAMASVFLAISTNAWRRHIVGQLKPSYHDRPYYFAFHAVMINVVKYLHSKGIKEKVDFVFDDEGRENIEKITSEFELFKQTAPPELREYIGDRPIPRDDKKMLPLQAADLLAWHIRRIMQLSIVEEDIPAMTAVGGEVFNIEQIRGIMGDKEVYNLVQEIFSRRPNPYNSKITPMLLPDPSSPWNWTA